MGFERRVAIAFLVRAGEVIVEGVYYAGRTIKGRSTRSPL